MDGRIRTLEKALSAEPADPEARRALRAALRRVADLSDRLAWSRADPAAQDAVLDVLARQLTPRLISLGAERFSAGGASCRVGRFRHVETGIVLHLLPGGHYLRGSAEDPLRVNEAPQHQVRTLPCLIGRLPVLQAEWDAAPGGRDARQWRGPRLPLESVSWVDAREWLEARGLRLPSEAEWEYACRAGTTSAYFWGEEPDERYARYGSGGASWRVHPPEDQAEFPNAFGLVDMAGNLGEWCEDHYVGHYRGASRDGSPRRTERGELRVVRGGDAYNPASHCRSAARNMAAATSRAAGIGFRAAASVPW